jgi:hypothetical protein
MWTQAIRERPSTARATVVALLVAVVILATAVLLQRHDLAAGARPNNVPIAALQDRGPVLDHQALAVLLRAGLSSEEARRLLGHR